jgi:biopolymer transport protein ExbB/TolQ
MYAIGPRVNLIERYYYMIFPQYVLASFLGTTFGIIFVMVLVYIVIIIKSYFIRKSLRGHHEPEHKYDTITESKNVLIETHKHREQITNPYKKLFDNSSIKRKPPQA